MNDDPPYRTLFREAHRADEAGAPDFDQVWSSVSGHHHRQRTRRRLAQVTTIAAVLLAVALVALRKSPPAVHETAASGLPWRSVVLLSEWRAPSDTLLAQSESYSFARPSPSETEH